MRRGLRFMLSTLALAVHHLDHLQGLFFHAHDDAIDPPAQIAVEDECGDGDRQACRGRDQRLADPPGQQLGSPQAVLLRETAGQLTPFDTLDLTLPADGLHVTYLYDGTIGLFTSNRGRGLVDFFRLSQGSWERRNSYYPGCNPVSVTSGDLNGDGLTDLALGSDGNGTIPGSVHVPWRSINTEKSCSGSRFSSR